MDKKSEHVIECMISMSHNFESLNGIVYLYGICGISKIFKSKELLPETHYALYDGDHNKIYNNENKSELIKIINDTSIKIYNIFHVSELLYLKKSWKNDIIKEFEIPIQIKLDCENVMEKKIENGEIIINPNNPSEFITLHSLKNISLFTIFGDTKSDSVIMQYVKNNDVHPCIFNLIMSITPIDILKHKNSNNHTLSDYIKMYIHDPFLKEKIHEILVSYVFSNFFIL